MSVKIEVPLGGRIPITGGTAVCVEYKATSRGCEECCFHDEMYDCDIMACLEFERKDGKSVLFKLEGGEK